MHINRSYIETNLRIWHWYIDLTGKNVLQKKCSRWRKWNLNSQARQCGIRSRIVFTWTQILQAFVTHFAALFWFSYRVISSFFFFSFFLSPKQLNHWVHQSTSFVYTKTIIHFSELFLQSLAAWLAVTWGFEITLYKNNYSSECSSTSDFFLAEIF